MPDSENHFAEGELIFDDDILFVSHLKRIINKVTYCVHCELCEVECPTGALVTHPKVKVDVNKCIKCFKPTYFEKL